MHARLGIIGAGQLGLYLCQAAQAMGIEVAVLSDTTDAPALLIADSVFVGAEDDLELLNQFLDNCDMVTFEKEAIADDVLARLLEAQKQGQITVQPGTDTLLLLKDKGLQKTWLVQNKLPTLPFQMLAGKSSLSVLTDQFGSTLVQKSRRGGYDGRGVQILDTSDASCQLWDTPSIVEPFLADSKEISVITVRTAQGETQTYAPVSMEFDPALNSVTAVCMPAAIDPQLSKLAVELAEKAVELLKGVGVFAIEMFLTPDGELLINEISPRVHNSGHVTLDACNVSQFEQHVRAVMGLPLVEIDEETPAVMLNILYAEPMRKKCPDKPTAEHQPDKGTTIYWYGKAPGQAGRKMGHINALAPTVEIAMKHADAALECLKKNKQECAA